MLAHNTVAVGSALNLRPDSWWTGRCRIGRCRTGRCKTGRCRSTEVMSDCFPAGTVAETGPGRDYADSHRLVVAEGGFAKKVVRCNLQFGVAEASDNYSKGVAWALGCAHSVVDRFCSCRRLCTCCRWGRNSSAGWRVDSIGLRF